MHINRNLAATIYKMLSGGYHNAGRANAMAVTMKDLAVNFSHLDYNTLFEDWHWLIGPSKLPIMLTAAGDAFVQDAEGGSIYFLDVGRGELHTIAGSDEELRSLLASKDFVVSHLAVQMVGAMMQAGRTLGPGQIYSFKVLPVLGGEYDLENIEVADIAVHYSLAGQIHEKMRNLPPGTPIDDSTIE